MYFYLYNANNTFQQIIVDDDGCPVAESPIDLENSEKFSVYRDNLKKDKKLLICGDAYTAEDALKITQVTPVNQSKKYTYIYNDEECEKIFNNMASEEDWEKFFKENEISRHVALTPLSYNLH